MNYCVCVGSSQKITRHIYIYIEHWLTISWIFFFLYIPKNKKRRFTTIIWCYRINVHNLKYCALSVLFLIFFWFIYLYRSDSVDVWYYATIKQTLGWNFNTTRFYNYWIFSHQLPEYQIRGNNFHKYQTLQEL